MCCIILLYRILFRFSSFLLMSGKTKSILFSFVLLFKRTERVCKQQNEGKKYKNYLFIIYDPYVIFLSTACSLLKEGIEKVAVN